MNTFTQLASKFGTTEVLRRAKAEYSARTVAEMRATVIDRARNALQVIKNGEEATSKNPMVRKVRNGLAIKFGYGAKNETLIVFGQDESGKDEVEIRFFEEERQKAVAYMEDVISAIEDGDLDDALEAKLADFRSRAEKGKAARRAKKAPNNVEPIGKAA